MLVPRLNPTPSSPVQSMNAKTIMAWSIDGQEVTKQCTEVEEKIENIEPKMLGGSYELHIF